MGTAAKKRSGSSRSAKRYDDGNKSAQRKSSGTPTKRQKLSAHDMMPAPHIPKGDEEAAAVPASSVPAEEAAFPRKRKSAAGSSKLNEEPEQQQQQLPHKTYLSRADLAVGSTLLGTVSFVTRREVLVDLPFHLKGFVPRDEIGEEVHTRQASLWMDPRQKFRAGQAVVAAVLGTDERLVKLTLKPQVVNAGWSMRNLKPGVVLSGTVRVFEDFGAVLESLSSGVTVSCLKPKGDSGLAAHRVWEGLKPGSLVLVSVKTVNPAAQSVVAVLCEDTAAKPLKFDEAVDLSLLRAGQLCEGRVDSLKGPSNAPFAAECTVARILQLTMSALQCSRVASPDEVGQAAKQQDEARVLDGGFWHLRQGMRISIRVTAVAAHKSLAFGSCTRESVTLRMPPLQPPRTIGKRLQNVRVTAADPKVGIRVATMRDGQLIHVDVAKAKAQDDLKAPLKFQVGQVVPEVRLTGRGMADGAYTGATAATLLRKELLSIHCLDEGQIFTGTIAHARSDFVLVKLGDSDVMGRLQRDHATDIPLLEFPKKNFAVDKKIKVRVLSVDAQYNTVELTAKPTLLKTDHVYRYLSDCVSSEIVHGVVGHFSAGCPRIPIRFFGHLIGYVPEEEFDKNEMNDKLVPGCVIRVRIAHVDLFGNRLLLSLNLTAPKSEKTAFSACSRVLQVLMHTQQKNAEGNGNITVEQAGEALNKAFDKMGGILAKLGTRVNKWNCKDTEVFISEPRRIRAMPLSGHLINDWEIIGCTDTDVEILYRFECDLNRENGEQDEKRIVHGISVGIIPLMHFTDALDEVPRIPENSKNLSALRKAFGSLPAVVLSPFAVVRAADDSSPRLCLSLLSLKASQVAKAKAKSFICGPTALESLVESVIPGYVIRQRPNGLVIGLGCWHVRGFLANTEEAAETVGRTVEVFVKGIKTAIDNPVQQSNYTNAILLRPAEAARLMAKRENCWVLGDPRLSKKFNDLPGEQYCQAIHPSELKVGKCYQGVVLKSSEQGIFVALSTTLQGRANPQHIRDRHPAAITVEEVVLMYPPGTVVPRVYVTRIGHKKLRNGEEAIEVSFSPDAAISRQDLSPGDVVIATVKAKTASGYIMGIKNSFVEGYCFWSDVLDIPKKLEKSKNSQEVKTAALGAYALGVDVAAIVSPKQETGARRVLLQLRRSAFKDAGEDFETAQEKLMKKMENEIDEI